MKKAFAFVLVLVIILGLAACGAVKEVQESKSLYAHGLDVVSMLSEMTRSESFIGIYTANSEIKDIILALSLTKVLPTVHTLDAARFSTPLIALIWLIRDAITL